VAPQKKGKFAAYFFSLSIGAFLLSQCFTVHLRSTAAGVDFNLESREPNAIVLIPGANFTPAMLGTAPADRAEL
jgi:hypothetical protein